jgi:hypothetical protein
MTLHLQVELADATSVHDTRYVIEGRAHVTNPGRPEDSRRCKVKRDGSAPNGKSIFQGSTR